MTPSLDHNFSQPAAKSATWVDPLRHEVDSRESVQADIRTEELKLTQTGILIEENVLFTTGQAFKRGCLNALWQPTILAMLITGVAFAIFVCCAGAGMLNGRMWAIPLVTLMMFGFAWVFVAVIAAPVCLIGALCTKQRRIRIEDGRLIHRTSCRTLKLPLKDCFWQITNRASDLSGRYFGSGSLVQIQTDNMFIVCGFCNEKRQEWIATLTELKVPEVVPAERGRMWLQGTAVSLSTACVGTGVGFVVSRLSGVPMWIASCMMIGFMDGAVLSLGLFYWTRRPPSVTNSRSGPLSCALMFAVLAVKCSIGIEGKVIAGLVNAGLGWFCGRYITQLAEDHAA